MESRNPFGFIQPAATRAASFDMGLRAYMLGIYNYMASALVLTGIRIDQRLLCDFSVGDEVGAALQIGVTYEGIRVVDILQCLVQR